MKALCLIYALKFQAMRVKEASFDLTVVLLLIALQQNGGRVTHAGTQYKTLPPT